MEKIKKICKELYAQPWVVVFCNVLLVMLLFSLQRLVYYWINIDMYPNIASKHLWEIFGGGVRFDMTAVFYLNSVYVVLSLLPFRFRENPTYQKVTKWFYFIPNTLGILANSIDTIYTRFSARRTTVDFFTEFANDGNLFTIFFQSIFQYWYLTLITIAFVAVLWYCYRAIQCADTSLIKSDKPYVYYIEKTLILCVTAYFYVIGIRGSFGGWTNPINIIHANTYANDPSEVNIVLNTPFTLMMSLDMAEKYACDEFYASNEELESVMSPIHIPADTLQEKRKNVVVFILESFSKEYSGFLNKHLDNGTYKGFMPSLDSIISQSVTYHYSFASGR
ncbi:MAG: LTA synthase family protein, partial [Paludibacteraceae bacterium]|nr:LTA synthase family protein [Paludibacteraceae bacterium]